VILLTVLATGRFGVGAMFALAGVDLMAGVGRWFCVGPFLFDQHHDDEKAENGQAGYKRNQIPH
jgi:dipeptide/tripeptide permease